MGSFPTSPEFLCYDLYMAILENLEAYLESSELCHYCQNKAKYTDVAQVNESYAIVGICKCHLSMEASS